MNHHEFLLAAALWLVAAGAPAAGNASAEQEPGLNDTARFVQDRVNAVGPLEYSLHRRDAVSGAISFIHVSAHTSNVTVLVYKKPKLGTQCLFSYHDKETQDDQVIEDRDLGVLLNDLEEVSIASVESIDQELHPTRRVSVTTPIYRLDLRSVDGGVNFLFFADRDQANEVAGAIARVAELCAAGGEKPTP